MSPQMRYRCERLRRRVKVTKRLPHGARDLVDCRVRLVHTTDPYTDLARGIEGTVSMVDDAGTVHVDWENGSTLGMVRRAGDRFEVIRRSVPKFAG
jgi:hypothetical protein